MKVVVNGGAGFIGSNLLRRLADSGDSVLVVDGLATGKRENWLWCGYSAVTLGLAAVGALVAAIGWAILGPLGAVGLPAVVLVGMDGLMPRARCEAERLNETRKVRA
jgi:NAD(P)-dependent dehydrogenase (short-subunit alcohol dehydrogenase family)